jgi:hypothetical protein
VPVAQQEQPVAAGGLVHDVAADDEGAAALGEAAEQRPQVAPQHGVQADGGLVEHQQLGLGEQRGREGHARLLAAGEPVDARVGGVRQVDVCQHVVDAAGRERRPLRRSTGGCGGP